MEQILCDCGCGQKRDMYDNRGRIRRFINGHGAVNTQFKIGHSNSSLDKNAMWNGGKTINGGYIMVKRPHHPNANHHGYVFEHRLVYEEYHKCCLLSWIVIHHIDGNKHNNTPDNLIALTQKQHTILEHTGTKRTIETRIRISIGRKRK